MEFTMTVLSWLLMINWIITMVNTKTTVATAQAAEVAGITSTRINNPEIVDNAQTVGSGKPMTVGNGNSVGKAPIQRKLNSEKICMQNLHTQCENQNFHECDFSGCEYAQGIDLRGSSLSGTLPTQLGTMVNLRTLYVRMKYLEAYY